MSRRPSCTRVTQGLSNPLGFYRPPTYFSTVIQVRVDQLILHFKVNLLDWTVTCMHVARSPRISLSAFTNDP